MAQASSVDTVTKAVPKVSELMGRPAHRRHHRRDASHVSAKGHATSSPEAAPLTEELLEQHSALLAELPVLAGQRRGRAVLSCSNTTTMDHDPVTTYDRAAILN